ncbi:MAG: hypothetical protein IMZ54_04145 [Acidobacteria bacterium]|nr:hypothetical protein [Acidobacteriota bacterium]MBE3129895.1 hypothetical protein [Acidobacteriota bacterium]
MNFDIISIKVDELGDLKFRLAHSGCRLAVVSRSQLGKTPMETLRNIPQNIKETRPHILLSVPALAKNFRKNIVHPQNRTIVSRLEETP